MEYKVAELEGALLDAAVAKAERSDPDETHLHVAAGWSPSTQWRDAGPIIERERITVGWRISPPACWDAWIDSAGAHAFGTTALIAAMRAYVASKFGETVELP